MNRILLARTSQIVLLVLLSATAAQGQALAPPSDAPEPVVELVLAATEAQAQVVGRAMATGFFIDQLLIPETQYLGRAPASKLPPSLRGALKDARPGEIKFLLGPQNQNLVARVLPDESDAVLGASQYALGAEEIQAVLTAGPTDPSLLSHEIDLDTEDLVAICKSKKAFLEEKLESARQAIDTLDGDAPAGEIVPVYAEAVSSLSLRGDLKEAIDTVKALRARLPKDGDLGRAYDDIMHRMLGVLELRRGEVENCLLHHHAEMCIFPLSENARHRLDDGAKKAFDHFLRFLENNPEDLEHRWLLNIAAMTLGTYPDGVPERFRIAPEAFESEVDPGRFQDVAMGAGLDYSDNAGGSIADDFDDDGLLDLVLSSRDPCEPLRFYRNRGDGTFEDLTEAAGLGEQLGGLNVIQTDYDGDGRLDLHVLRGGWETAIRDSLLRNRPTEGGGLVFEDVTARAGLGGPAHRTHSSAWADFDGDGAIDVFLGHELSFSRLMRNRGDGTFEDVTRRAGVRFRSFTKGAAWGDVDNDGRPDLYVSNFGERNLLFRNRGDGTFEEIARQSGVEEPTYSFPTWFFDYDNDGDEDLLVATLLQTVDDVAREILDREPKGETLRIYRNRGDGTFDDASEELGMNRVVPTMGANFGDLDNDGYLDLYLGTGAPPYGMLVPNRLFKNQQGRGFVDVTTATGTGHLQKGHGVSFADFDHDGDQDIFINLGGAFLGDKYPSALFENPGHDRDWIEIRLVGTRSHRAAIGARLSLLVESDGKERRIHRTVGSGGSFGSSPLRQHIGLGRDARIVRLEIEWPLAPGPEGRARQIVEAPPVNQGLVVTEGVDGFEVVERPRFTFSAGGHDH